MTRVSTIDGGYIVGCGSAQSACVMQALNASGSVPDPKSTFTMAYLPSSAVGAQ